MALFMEISNRNLINLWRFFVRGDVVVFWPYWPYWPIWPSLRWIWPLKTKAINCNTMVVYNNRMILPSQSRFVVFTFNRNIIAIYTITSWTLRKISLEGRFSLSVRIMNTITILQKKLEITRSTSLVKFIIFSHFERSTNAGFTLCAVVRLSL